MVQAARSGMQNIAEGYKQESLKGYIKLSGVSRGSLEELLNDYTAYARQNNISIWTKEKSEREIDEIGAIWNVLRYNDTLPDHPDFPDLPRNKVKAVNLMITIVNQSNYLIDKLIKSLEAKHEQEGGLSEKLYRKRVQYRKRYGK